MNTTETPMRKFNVNGCPNNAALNNPVKIVAMVEEYFFKMVSANLKKKLDNIPWSALFTINAKVTVLNPEKSPLPVPPAPPRIDTKSAPITLNNAP